VGPRPSLDNVEKNVVPTGTPTPTPSVVQPVASRYTDYATPAPACLQGSIKSYHSRVENLTTVTGGKALLNLLKSEFDDRRGERS
jgi:hypothetical protein